MTEPKLVCCIGITIWRVKMLAGEDKYFLTLAPSYVSRVSELAEKQAKKEGDSVVLVEKLGTSSVCDGEIREVGGPFSSENN
jgi:hypothetical protein